MKKKLAKAQKGKVTGSEQGTGAKILRTAGMAVPIVGGGIMAIAARRKAKKAQREAQKYTDEKLKGTQNKNAEGAKEFKRGGMKKPLRKAQYGDVVRVPGMKKSQAKAEEFYDKNPSVRTYTNEYTGKKIPTGPMTKKEYQDAAEAFQILGHQTLKEYLLAYNLTDVYVLCEVCEQYEKNMVEKFQLYPFR